MINKKSWLQLSWIWFFSIVLIPLISAQTSSATSAGSRQIITYFDQYARPIFAAILGIEEFDQYFFARILFLVLIYIIVSLSLENIDIFKGNRGVNFVVSAVVALLGARYIGGLKVIESMLLPYGALTIGISILLPVIIFGFFIHKSMSSGIARRFAWIFFAVLYFGLWWTRRGEAGLIEFKWLYQAGIIIVLALFIADSKVHGLFGSIEIIEAKNKRIKLQLADIEEKLTKYSAIPNPSQTVKDTIKHLERRQKELNQEL